MLFPVVLKLVPLREVENISSHAHKNRTLAWSSFQIFDEYPPPLYMEAPPTPTPPDWLSRGTMLSVRKASEFVRGETTKTTTQHGRSKSIWFNEKPGGGGWGVGGMSPWNYIRLQSVTRRKRQRGSTYNVKPEPLSPNVNNIRIVSLPSFNNEVLNLTFDKCWGQF